MNYPHTCSVRVPAIISQRLSTESLIERKPLRYGMNYPHTCSVRVPAIKDCQQKVCIERKPLRYGMNYPHTACSVRDPTIISQRLSTESLYREKATQVWYELPSYM